MLEVKAEIIEAPPVPRQEPTVEPREKAIDEMQIEQNETAVVIPNPEQVQLQSNAEPMNQEQPEHLESKSQPMQIEDQDESDLGLNPDPR